MESSVTQSLYAWGVGSNLQLGVKSDHLKGKSKHSMLPEKLFQSPHKGSIVDASAFTNYTVYCDSNGDVYGMGRNSRGRILGDGGDIDHIGPTKIKDLLGLQK